MSILLYGEINSVVEIEKFFLNNKLEKLPFFDCSNWRRIIDKNPLIKRLNDFNERRIRENFSLIIIGELEFVIWGIT